MDGRLTEAEVVHWLKRALVREGLGGRRVRDIVVDADGSYLRSPFRRHLEPTGTIRIGGWRPDLVCVVDGPGAERLAGFEVKAAGDHERGIIQAARYRDGVHEAYLCIPRSLEAALDWVRRSVDQNGVGLVRAAPGTLLVEVEPEPPRPDPRILTATRSSLLGEVAVRAFGLNKPLHYAAALTAFAYMAEPWTALRGDWALGDAAIRLAVRGAEALGLVVAAGTATVRGRAHADVLRLMGFTLDGCRHLTRTRLVTSAPHLAAELRTILLHHPAVDLVVQALMRHGGAPLDVCELARQASRIDAGLATAVFGAPAQMDRAWVIRATTRFQLKAALYDVGLIDTPLARGASGPQTPGGYDPLADTWQLGAACRPAGRPMGAPRMA